MEVYDLRVAVNSWVAGKDVVTFFNVTLWPGRFEGMLKLLEKGKSVFFIWGILHVKLHNRKW